MPTVDLLFRLCWENRLFRKKSFLHTLLWLLGQETLNECKPKMWTAGSWTDSTLVVLRCRDPSDNCYPSKQNVFSFERAVPEQPCWARKHFCWSDCRSLLKSVLSGKDTPQERCMGFETWLEFKTRTVRDFGDLTIDWGELAVVNLCRQLSAFSDQTISGGTKRMWQNVFHRMFNKLTTARSVCWQST